MTGILYLCATPIGNLGDMTPRVVETLRSVDLIAAEDTRNSLKLMTHFEIHTPMTSYHEYNKVEKAYTLIAKLQEGQNIALITDAGTPAISDPGEVLVRMCLEAGIRVTSLPGAAACITALTMSGLSTRRFCFEGFLPPDKKERTEILEDCREESRTMIFYEAPHKLPATLRDLYAALGDRRIAIVREITKVHEEVLRTTLGQAAGAYADGGLRGEIVLVIEGAEAPAQDAVLLEDAVEIARGRMAAGQSASDAARQTARETGLKKGDLYKALLVPPVENEN